MVESTPKIEVGARGGSDRGGGRLKVSGTTSVVSVTKSYPVPGEAPEGPFIQSRLGPPRLAVRISIRCPDLSL